MAVVYLMSGPAHLPYLVASLHSLRKHYAGEVQIHAWEESFDIVQRIADDPQLGDVNAYPRKPALRRSDGVKSNAQFFDKIQLMASVPHSEWNVYVDADTLVMGSIDVLLGPITPSTSFMATQFNDWRTGGGVIAKRLHDLNQFADRDIRCHVDRVILGNYPSVNGGVFACRRNSGILTQWYAWCMLCRSSFIADEKCLHLFSGTSGSGFEVLQGGAYNCSPKYQPKELRNEDVAIWHFHGDSNVRPNKCQRGVDMWYPVWQQCLDANVGGCRDWWHTCRNKYLRSQHPSAVM